MKNHSPQYVLPVVLDVHGRTFKTLRVSLTEICNFGCVYCVEGLPKSKVKKSESLDDLVAGIKALHGVLDLDVVRLTGGEPTVYRDLVPLVSEVVKLGVHVKMTTNGLLLPSLIHPLKRAGLRSINVSLDAVDPVTFEKVARNSGLHKVVSAIDLALESGMDVKLNSVILKGWNDHQVLPLLEFAKVRNITIRFLELMRMGHLHSHHFDELFYSQNEILEVVSSVYAFDALPRTQSSTANYWQMNDGYKFGIIANETTPFCGDCDRLRLDSSGNIYGCLSVKSPISIKDCLTDKTLLTEKLDQALSQKQSIRFEGSELSMMEIGG